MSSAVAQTGTELADDGPGGPDNVYVDDRPRTARTRPWLRRLTLAVIASAALGIRVPGIRWGLPYGLHPDEGVVTLNALDLVKRHSLTPRVFDRPDHLEVILNSLAYRAYAHFGPGVAAPVDYGLHPWRYLEISRSITVAFSVVAVLLAWCVGRRFNTQAAVAAALLIAFFPPFVANSSYATPDMPLTCLMLLVVLAMMHYLQRPTLLWLLVGAGATGVGVTIKYPAAIGGLVVGAIVLVATVRSRDWWRGVRHLVLAPTLFLLAVLIVSHSLITDFSQVRFQLSNQRGTSALGAEPLGWAGNLGYYSGQYGSWAGLLLLAAGVIGAVWCVRERAVVALPLLFGVVYWLGLSTVPAHWPRWGLPMYLSPLLFAAVGIGWVVQWIGQWWRQNDVLPRVYAGVAATLVAVSLVQLLSGAAGVATGFAAEDTRIAAMPEFARVHATAANTVFDGYSPLYPTGPKTVVANLRVQDGKLQVVNKPGAKFVAISSYMYARYFALDRYAAEQAVYRAVQTRLKLVGQWVPAPPPQPSALEPQGIARSLRYVDRVAGGADGGPVISLYALS